MYKLNKKGFAVTTVVYSILVLLILFMFILLAIVRGSYFNEKDFTKEVQVELDTYLKNMGADTKKPVCTFDSSNIKLSVDQTVSVTLTCLDEAGINEVTIDKEKFKYSNVSIEEIAKGEEVIDETVSTKSGYKYVIKIKGTEVGDATFILALRGTGYTEANKITVLNKTNSAPAGTIQFVEVANAHDTETYTVFFAANTSGLENAATFNITYNK